MDGDGRIPYGGSLGCLPAPCCPVSASCSARDLLLSHRLDTCVAYHPHLLRLYVYIYSSAAGSIKPRKAYSTAVHRFRHDPGIHFAA